VIAVLVALAADANAWWWGMGVGALIGFTAARWDQALAFAARLLEHPRPPAWPQPAGPARSHLRLIWSATPRAPYDFEADEQNGDVA
jgi:hypothetical protein